MLLAAMLVQLGPGGAGVAHASALSSAPWGEPNFPFREGITVSNPTPSPISSEPVLVHLSFPYGHLVDAVSGLVLGFPNGTVIPSFVVDQTGTEGFIDSAWLLFSATLPPASTQTLWLYYGNPTSPAPSYRAQSQVPLVRSGLIGMQQASTRPGSLFYTYVYGGTYSESIYSRISYGNQSQNQYGTIEISNNLLDEILPWRAIGNSSSVPFVATSATSSGPRLRVVQLNLLSHSIMTTIYLITNTGTTPLSQTSLTNLIDASQLGTLSLTTTTYDKSTGAVVTNVGGTLVGYEGTQIPSAYTVGTFSQVANEILLDNFIPNSQSVGPSAAALSWSLGTLDPGETAKVETAWSAAPSIASLYGSLSSVGGSPTIAVGSEETLQSLQPTSSVYRGVSLSFNNLLIGTSGLGLPLTITGGTWIPNSVGLTGVLNYSVPAAGFSQTSSSVWTAYFKATGDSIARASSAFYSVQDSAYEGHISASTFNSTSSAAASLITSEAYIRGNPSTQLVVRYQAQFSGTGNASSQLMYAAVDFDHGLKGVFDQTAIIPLIGTGVAVGCPTGEFLPFSHPVVDRAGQIVADGSWRTLSLNLGSFTSGTDFGFRIRFCASLFKSFVGTMEIRILLAEVNVAAPANTILTPTIDSRHPLVSLQLAPHATLPLSGARLTGNLSFVVANNEVLGADSGSKLSTLPTPDPTIRLNATSSQPFVKISSRVEGIAVPTQFATLSPSVFVGGVKVPALSVAGGSIYAGGQGLDKIWNASGKDPAISIAFSGYGLNTIILDANGHPVKGTNITVSAGNVHVGSFALTGDSGSATINLVPWSYNITVTYQGYRVAQTSVALTAGTTLTLQSSVIETKVRFNDAFGRPIASALVTLTGSKGSTTIQGLTDAGGSFTFLAPINGVYHATLTSGGTTFYNGDIRAALNNAEIIVDTSYYLTNFFFALITLAVTVALVCAVLAYYLITHRSL
jgi:hypothetical protein